MTTILSVSESTGQEQRPSLFDSMWKRFQELQLSVQEELELQRRILMEDWEVIAANHNGVSKHELTLRKQLKCFENDLHSSFFVQKLNTAIQNRISSGIQTLNYYKNRPDLREYTLEKELHRISYTLHTPNGERQLTSANQILEYVQTERADKAMDHELLYRAANQSIFGETIVALTSFDGLLRPQLQTGTFVDKCSITIDLRRNNHPHVRAQCFLKISIPDANGNRLQIAVVLVSIKFCPTLQEFNAGISNLLPLSHFTEAQINGSAHFLSTMFLPQQQLI